ncbi:glycosyltransferase family 1 protein [Crenobacter sp. SG2303]|uniref:Glycosyltransferase family 1 protein n=1 Tax=Crenobacter oryzisoli TaxID=3056844 RepID=A0ABT7XSR5_9NEIS|nr:glycosyltransferase family 1 protein [Crenobacter sp. SG2303]MDN0076846.1 glycosyltransferase family 1 protein [Crenobacter sp. SG2303]
MKVILSVEPVRFPLTGIGRYTWELARQLQKSQEISELRFFAGRHFLSDLPTAGEQSDHQHKLKRWVQQSYIATEAYRLLMPMLKRQSLRGYEDFLYHGPNFFLPPFAGKRVATFHDLSPFTWTQCNTPQRIRFTQKELLKTLQRADALITDSDFTRTELADYFSWPMERIHTVPLACGPDFHPRAPEQLLPALTRYGLSPGGYTLFVGTIEPRKNILTLLDAYSKLPRSLRQRWPLILTGYRGWRSELIHERIQQAEHEGWARYLGFTPAEDLPLLFAGARLFAFPSHYEGFGLPVLEAMRSGVPVVCSNSSSLPEVAGDAALMCASEDVDSLQALLQQGLEDEVWRTAAIVRGLKRVEQFSWQRCAEETQAVYRKVLEA